jgi:hypothetical protein
MEKRRLGTHDEKPAVHFDPMAKLGMIRLCLRRQDSSMWAWASGAAENENGSANVFYVSAI